MDRVKIVSDGSPHGTKVYDSSGKEIPMIESINIRIVPGYAPKAEIVIINPNLEIVAESEVEERAYV